MLTRFPLAARIMSVGAALSFTLAAACSPQVQDADTVVATEAPYESADDAAPLPADAPGVGADADPMNTADMDGQGAAMGAGAIDGEVGSPDTTPGDQSVDGGDAPANRATT